MKVYRLDEAAERLGVSPKVLEIFEVEGRIQPHEKLQGVSYYSQSSLDTLIQDLSCSMQRASWRDIEIRMEDVERRLETTERELKRIREESSRLI
ncbi:MAG: MerR family transcriptional regulator [Planctomycetota bacterium]